VGASPPRDLPSRDQIIPPEQFEIAPQANPASEVVSRSEVALSAAYLENLDAQTGPRDTSSPPEAIASIDRDINALRTPVVTHSKSLEPTAENVIHVLAPQFFNIDPCGPSEFCYLDRKLRFQSAPRQVEADTRQLFKDALTTASVSIRNSFLLARNPPMVGEKSEISLYRAFLATKSYQLPQALAQSSLPAKHSVREPTVFKIDPTPKAKSPIPPQDSSATIKTFTRKAIQCRIVAPITPFKLAKEADIPRPSVVKAMLELGMKNISEFSPLTHDQAVKIAARYGRALIISYAPISLPNTNG
jgi:hypothetical protein